MKTQHLLIILIYFILTAGCSHIRPEESPGLDEDPWAAYSERRTEQDELKREMEEQQNLILQQARTQGEIVVGMPMEDVASMWGNPSAIETAGDARYRNQRWVYYHGLSSRSWSLRSARVVYFENGRVVGWESTRDR